MDYLTCEYCKKIIPNDEIVTTSIRYYYVPICTSQKILDLPFELMKYNIKTERICFESCIDCSIDREEYIKKIYKGRLKQMTVTVSGKKDLGRNRVGTSRTYNR